LIARRDDFGQRPDLGDTLSSSHFDHNAGIVVVTFVGNVRLPDDTEIRGGTWSVGVFAPVAGA
jgi:hypothetical protein